MDPTTKEVLEIAGGGTFAVALLTILYSVGQRLIAAIDRFTVKLDTVSVTNAEAHADHSSALSALNAKLDERIRARTPGRGSRLVTDGGDE